MTKTTKLHLQVRPRNKQIPNPNKWKRQGPVFRSEHTALRMVQALNSIFRDQEFRILREETTYTPIHLEEEKTA